MHIFFATNNLGGGGTNVSRFLIHLDKIKTKHIGILLNYYYLNPKIKKSPAFDQDVLKKIFNYSDIKEFIRYVKQIFIGKDRQPENISTAIEDTIKHYILDSGTGNILRDFIKENGIKQDFLSGFVELYLQFSEKLKFDLVVALDYALKYTYKDDEGESKIYQELSKEFTNNEKANLNILETTIKCIKANNHSQKIIAPLHGYNFDSYNNYLAEVLNLEAKEKYSFYGFGLGGIADTRKLKNNLWGVPESFNQKMKSHWLISQLTKNISKKIDKRELHVLGAGNISVIPLISYLGATSSDCHSAWRRANDGESKMLIPLISSKLQFIDNVNSWEYIELSEIQNMNCDCPICREYNIVMLKEMIESGENEKFYFAKILIFIHALYQYDYVISYCEQKSNFINDFLSSPNNGINQLYKIVLNNVK